MGVVVLAGSVGVEEAVLITLMLEIFIELGDPVICRADPVGGEVGIDVYEVPPVFLGGLFEGLVEWADQAGVGPTELIR